jgi:hypothetical protein
MIFRRLPFLVATLLLAVFGPVAARAQSPLASAPAAASPVWEAVLPGFDEGAYAAQVERIFARYESTSGKALKPGPKGKVGLKIYADSGPGMATPMALVKAVIGALERRGFTREGIFLVGLNPLRLRMTGYLPSLSTGATPFKDYRVFVLESGRYYDPGWFYDSPLPTRFDPILAEKSIEGINENSTREEDRKSFLATPLFLEADFWINLPVYTDHPTLGVNGALVNATLWNASNTARFFRSPANAPAAVAEMSAIPELRQTWALTIASLQHYQFIGGPYFNALYSVSEPLIWASMDPVAMDAMMLARINDWRKRSGFPNISDEIRTLDFAEQLGVGTQEIPQGRVVRLE